MRALSGENMPSEFPTRGCTATDDSYRLELSDLGSRGIVRCSENKGADQLCCHGAADLHLCFCIFKKQVFLRLGS